MHLTKVVAAAYKHFSELHTGENIDVMFEETFAAFDIGLPQQTAGWLVGIVGHVMSLCLSLIHI